MGLDASGSPCPGGVLAEAGHRFDDRIDASGWSRGSRDGGQGAPPSVLAKFGSLVRTLKPGGDVGSTRAEGGSRTRSWSTPV
jgi:hypothetical protein